jgi:hypothetical protein
MPQYPLAEDGSMIRYVLMTLMVGMSMVPGTGRAGEAFFIHVHDVDNNSGSFVFEELIGGRCFGFRVRHITLTLKDFKVYNGVGNLLGADELMEKIKPGMLLVIAKIGNKINRGNLFFLTKETMIVIVPTTKDLSKLACVPESLSGFLCRKMGEPGSWLVGRITEHFVGE